MKTLSPYEKTHLARYGKTSYKPKSDDNKPVEYVTGKVEFNNRVFGVDSRVLIPRVETEELVNLAVAKIQTKFKKGKLIEVADVGTGSGVIGITLLLELTALGFKPRLTLSDISKEALTVCQQNLAQLVKNEKIFQINLLQSNLFKNLKPRQTFDLIIANLPYIPSSRLESLDKSVIDHEPILALDGGPDGLTVIKQLISDLPKRLKPDGIAILEIDETHTQEQLSWPELSLEIIQDSFGKNRFAIYTKK